MKKLLIIAFLLFCTNAHADTITFDTTATLSRSFFIGTLLTAFNEINGGLNSDNFKNLGIESQDIATNTSPLIRGNENVGEYVYTGLTIADGALAATITAGTAYITNDGDGTLHRVVMAATSKTFTDSATTWVYLDFTGAYNYIEQVTQPTTPANSTIIAKVVASGTITVTDQRRTSPPNLRRYQDLISGAVLSRDMTDTDEIEISRGEIDFSGSVRRNSSTVEINFDVTGRGGLDTGSLAKGFYYIHALADDANDENWEGIASLSATDATGVTGERLIGWCYAPSTTVISPDSVGAYRGLGSGQPNVINLIGTTSITTASTSPILMPEMEGKFYSSGRPVLITFSGGCFEHDTAATDILLTLSIDSAAPEGIGTSNALAQFQGQSSASKIDPNAGFTHLERLTAGEHTIQVKWWTEAGTATQSGTKGIRQLIIQEL